VAEVVEADRANLADGRELELALGAPAGVLVGGRLLVAAALAPALVDIAGDEVRLAHRPPEHELELRPLVEHLAVSTGEDELRWRGGDRPAEVLLEFCADRDRLGAVPLRGIAVVRVGDGDHP